MKTRIALAAAIVALFATTADAGQAARSTDHRIIRLNDSAESLIKARLKDPDSAKFDAVFVRNSSGVPMICGTVTSKSGSSAKALKRLSHTPAFDQREKRRKVLFQEPTCSGKSRHGAPVRATHSTPSTNRRLSRPVTPRSDSLPGTRSLIRSHCVSDKTVRIKTASFRKTVLNHTDTHLGIPFIVHGP